MFLDNCGGGLSLNLLLLHHRWHEHLRRGLIRPHDQVWCLSLLFKSSSDLVLACYSRLRLCYAVESCRTSRAPNHFLSSFLCLLHSLMPSNQIQKRSFISQNLLLIKLNWRVSVLNHVEHPPVLLVYILLFLRPKVLIVVTLPLS